MEGTNDRRERCRVTSEGREQRTCGELNQFLAVLQKQDSRAAGVVQGNGGNTLRGEHEAQGPDEALEGTFLARENAAFGAEQRA